MGSEELLAALRCEGERKLALIRQEATTEAARLREEADAAHDRLRDRMNQEQTRAVAAAQDAIIAKADREARHLTLAAEEELANRLLELARRLLPRLRSDDYPAKFSRLAAELPPVAWERVRVNPEDAGLAASHFSGAKVVMDGTICGGMDAEAEGGRVQVVNTLEKRLERCWPDLLPILLKEVKEGA